MTAKQIDRYQDLLLERIYSAKGGDINLENRLYAKKTCKSYERKKYARCQS